MNTANTQPPAPPSFANHLPQAGPPLAPIAPVQPASALQAASAPPGISPVPAKLTPRQIMGHAQANAPMGKPFEDRDRNAEDFPKVRAQTALYDSFELYNTDVAL